MMFDAEQSLVFGVGEANRESFRELRVLNEVPLMRRVPWLKEKRGVADPLAPRIVSVMLDATWTEHMCSHRAAGYRDKHQERRHEQSSHLLPVASVTSVTLCCSIEPDPLRLVGTWPFLSQADDHDVGQSWGVAGREPHHLDAVLTIVGNPADPGPHAIARP